MHFFQLFFQFSSVIYHTEDENNSSKAKINYAPINLKLMKHASRYLRGGTDAILTFHAA
jgi:hypothetical protein